MISQFHAKLFDSMKDVGEPRFNLAHERLFNMIVDADEILGRAVTAERTLVQEDWEALSGVCDALAMYSKQHFAEEEEFLFKQGYPDLDRHRVAHHSLIEELNSFQKKVIQRDEMDLKELRRWMLEWLLHHVNHEDYAYAVYLFKK
ncbi:MAG: hemerythrin family protein [Magnetococcales bacterium]|nr:hemerythrin family protein [Magnetococcales bacterium]